MLLHLVYITFPCILYPRLNTPQRRSNTIKNIVMAAPASGGQDSLQKLAMAIASLKEKMSTLRSTKVNNHNIILYTHKYRLTNNIREQQRTIQTFHFCQ